MDISKMMLSYLQEKQAIKDRLLNLNRSYKDINLNDKIVDRESS